MGKADPSTPMVESQWRKNRNDIFWHPATGCVNFGPQPWIAVNTNLLEMNELGFRKSGRRLASSLVTAG